MTARICIAVLACACAARAGADTLKLANGDTLSGEILEWAVDYVVIEHPQLGEIRLSLEQLDIDTGEPPNKGLFGTGFLRGWNRSINFGWNGKNGNSESLNMTALFDFNYTDEFKRWRFNGRYFFNSDEDGVTDNNARIDLRRDWLFPGRRLFAFGKARYQYDKFESWVHRTVLSFGPGYNLVQHEKHELDARLGAAFTREYSGQKDNQADALFALDYNWRPADRYHLRLTNELFTEVAPSAGEIRNLTIAELTINITEDPGLNFKLGVENEYETDVPPGDVENDLKYWLTVGLNF